MKKFISVLILLIILFIISCKTDSGNEDTDPTGTDKARWGSAILGTDKWNP